MRYDEFKIKQVTRYALTHYHEVQDEDCSSGGCRTVGEFPSIEAAEEVGVALNALVPNSVLTTLPGRSVHYPPRTLQAAMAVRQGEQEVNSPQRFYEYVIIQRTFTTETSAWYEETLEKALECKASCEKDFNTDFRIFQREIIEEDDPVKYAHRKMQGY